MIALLNQQLADTTDLYSQTKQAHWNVKGIHFYPLHLLFDQLAEKRIGEADELAERATELGGYATGTMRMAAAGSRLPEIPTDIDAGVDYVRALVERYAHPRQQHARRASTKPTRPATRTPPTSSPRSRGSWTRTSGSCRPICRMTRRIVSF